MKHGDGAGGPLGFSLFHRNGFDWNSAFSAKNIPFKTLYFKSFKSNGVAIYVSRIKPAKIFRLKIEKSLRYMLINYIVIFVIFVIFVIL